MCSPVVKNLGNLLSQEVTPIKNIVSICINNLPVSSGFLSVPKTTSKKLLGQILSPNTCQRSSDPKQRLSVYSPTKQHLSTVSKCLFSPIKSQTNLQKNHLITPTRNKKCQNEPSFDTPCRNLSPKELIRRTEGFILGKGSYGVVVKGKYKDEKVAVKIITKTDKFEVRSSLISEMNAIKLNHRNIIQVYQVVEQPKNNMAYVFMELYSHRNLETVIQNEIVPAKTKAKYLNEIGSALVYCHQNKILHLDVKPKNVIVRNYDNKTKLCDFGSSRNIEDNRKLGSLHKGTLKYSAPELLRGEMATEKSDTYSFGVTMWQLIHQQIPYDNEDLHIVVYKVVTQNYRPHECKAPVFNTNMVSIYKACWEGNPDKRPSMAQVKEMLNITND